MAARNASLFGVADFYSRISPRWAIKRPEIHVNNPGFRRRGARARMAVGTEPSPPLPAAPSCRHGAARR